MPGMQWDMTLSTRASLHCAAFAHPAVRQAYIHDSTTDPTIPAGHVRVELVLRWWGRLPLLNRRVIARVMRRLDEERAVGITVEVVLAACGRPALVTAAPGVVHR